MLSFHFSSLSPGILTVFPFDSEQICRPYANTKMGKEKGMLWLGVHVWSHCRINPDLEKPGLEANVSQVGEGLFQGLFKDYF